MSCQLDMRTLPEDLRTVLGPQVPRRLVNSLFQRVEEESETKNTLFVKKAEQEAPHADSKTKDLVIWLS